MAHAAERRRSLLAISKEDGALAIGISMAVLSTFGAVALAFSVLHILKKYPKALTKMLVFIQVGVPLILGVVALACGVWPGFIVQVIIAGIFLYLWRQQLALASQMLSVTASAVQENPSVVWVSLGLNLVTFASYLGIIALVFGGCSEHLFKAQYRGDSDFSRLQDLACTCADEEAQNECKKS